MFDKKNPKKAGKWTILFLFSALIIWLMPVLAGEPEGGDTPQAVFEAAQKAGANKDLGALAKLVAPSERAMLAFGTDMGVGMFIEFYEGEKAPELKKKYQEIQQKYEIKTETEENEEPLQITSETPQEVIDAHMRERAKKLYGHVDVVSYVPELMAIMFSMPEMADQPVFPHKELSDLKIDGDQATGTADDKELKFIREDGRWYLTADIMD